MANPPWDITLISNSPWVGDAVALHCHNEATLVLRERHSWSADLPWPKESPADLRLLAFDPNDKTTDSFLEALKTAPQSLPNLALVFSHKELWMKRLLSDNVMGYLTLSQGLDEMTQAITHIMQGDTYVPHRYVKSLMNPQPSEIETLSPREKVIGRLLVSGHTHQDIAQQLHISDKTVSTHKINLLKRLGLRHLPDLVRFHDQHPMVFRHTTSRTRRSN